MKMKISTETESIVKLVGDEKAIELIAKAGFDAFSHTKSIHKKVTWFDFPVRYNPHNNKVFNFLAHLYMR